MKRKKTQVKYASEQILCNPNEKLKNGLAVEFFLQREAVCIVHIYISFGIKVQFQYQGKNEKFSRSHVRTPTEHILWIGANFEVFSSKGDGPNRTHLH